MRTISPGARLRKPVLPTGLLEASDMPKNTLMAVVGDPGVLSLMRPTKQLVWNEGLDGVAASRRNPFTALDAEVKVCAGNASTVNPAPAGLLTRENPAKGWFSSEVSTSWRKPNCDPAGKPGQSARKLAKPIPGSGIENSGQASGVVGVTPVAG